MVGIFVAAGDVNGDGLNDIVVNDGPSVLLQRADAPGSFAALRPLRRAGQRLARSSVPRVGRSVTTILSPPPAPPASGAHTREADRRRTD